MDHDSRLPAAVAMMRQVESADVLDRAGAWVGRAAALLPSGRAGDWLRGKPVGHAAHPFLTDVPIGLWTAGVVLDLRGRPQESQAADALIALGVAGAVPAAVTGLAEWRALGRRDARTGTLHAMLNVLALTLYSASLVARARGARPTGVGLSLAATGVTAASGFLGGHLAIARKAGSRDPEFVDSLVPDSAASTR